MESRIAIEDEVLHRVEFLSQRGREHGNIGCGVASLMMLLRHHQLPVKVPSYRQLCECLWLTVDPDIKGWSRRYGRGAYTTDVERALKGMASLEGDHIQFSKIQDERAERALRRIERSVISGPIMSAMKGKGFGAGEGHWIVILGHENSELRYLDPWLRYSDAKTLSHAAFHAHWDGYSFFLNHPCKCY